MNFSSQKTKIRLGPHRHSCKDQIESYRLRALLEFNSLLPRLSVNTHVCYFSLQMSDDPHCYMLHVTIRWFHMAPFHNVE